MIVPKNNQKTYGVLHTENYFSFTGFCKKVDSDEVQQIDIYIDDTLIDSILADKYLKIIDDIYDIEGFGFTYDLEEKYIGREHIISFKNYEMQENLQNSPYTLIDTENINFNKARFLSHSEVLPNKNIVKNSIGFIITKENLEDIDFTNYLKEILTIFPQITVKGFYFYNEDLNLVKEIFKKELTRFEFFIPIDINELTEKVNIFLFNSKYPILYRESFNIIVEKFPRIYSYQFFANYKQLNLINYDKKFENHPHLIDPNFFNLKVEDNSYAKTTFNPILKKLNLPQIEEKKDMYKFWHIDCLEYVLNNNSMRIYFSDLTKKYFEYRKNEIK